MAGGFGAGFAACILSSLSFGTMFVPIKPYECHDGFFVQWVMSASIFIVGLIVNLIQGSPQFYPLAMLGGFLWSTGNVTAVPIISIIGMGLGILIWGSTNMLAGWASGRFGAFNTKPQIPESDLLNAIGLVLAVISTVMFFFVKNRPNSRPASPAPQEDAAPLLSEDGQIISDKRYDNDKEVANRGPLGDTKRIFAIVMALGAGVCYGMCFTPIIYIQDKYDGASQSGLDYVFAQFTGIFATSTCYLVAYCAYKQNIPKVNPKSILPALMTGLFWAVAQASWFVANERLSEAVTFPIITRFPGIVASLWGVFYFKEIRGPKNLQILFWAIIVTLIGGILSGLSKVIKI